MNRLIYKYLDEWLNNDRNALLITGARQTGKTYSVRQWGKKNFKHFVEINFIEMPDAHEVFSKAKSAHDILFRLSLMTSTPLIKGETVIFLDEVQECPDIVTAIKFLVDDGSYRYVMSGSLLGVELKDVRSVPVGYLTVKQMYPLCFIEFLWAVGVGDDVIERLRHSFENRMPVDTFVHNKIMEIFRLYLIVGGMPAAVDEYVKTNNLQNVMRVQQSIIALYKKDISKYDTQRKLYLNEIFDLIPPELNEKNKRFILKNVNEHLKFSRYENSFLWLKDAGVALPTYNVEEPKAPLLLSRSRNLFKLFLNDVGLLACQYANGVHMRILNGDDSINYGSVYENVIAQELRSHDMELFYFNSKRQGELDFVVEIDGTVVPIEVKSGKSYERHRALSNVMSCDLYDLPYAYVLCNDNVNTQDKVIYMPVYMAMFIKKEEMQSIVYKIDLGGL